MATLNKDEMLALVNNPAPSDVTVVPKGPDGSGQSAPLTPDEMVAVQKANAKSAQDKVTGTGAMDQTQGAPPGLPTPAPEQPMSASVGGTSYPGIDEAKDAVTEFEDKSAQALQADQDEQNNATVMAESAEEAKAKVAKFKAGLEAPIIGQQVVAAKNYEDAVQRINMDAEVKTKAALANIQAASQAAQNFQFKDFWASRSAMGTAMGLLSAALGGAAAGMSGNPGAPTALDRVIAQDWEQQKAEYGKLQNNVQNARSYFSDLVSQSGDLRNAELAHYTAVTEKFKSMLTQVANQVATPQAQANLQVGLAQVEQAQAEKNTNWTKTYLENAKAAAGERVQIGLRRDELHAAMMKGLEAHEQNPLASFGIKGGGKAAPAEINKVRDSLEIGKTVIPQLQELLKNPSILNDAKKKRALAEELAIMDSPSGRVSPVILQNYANILGVDLKASGNNVMGEAMQRFAPMRKDQIQELIRATRAKLRERIKGLNVEAIDPSSPYYNEAEDAPAVK